VKFQGARAQQPAAALPTAAAEGQRAPLHARRLRHTDGRSPPMRAVVRGWPRDPRWEASTRQVSSFAGAAGLEAPPPRRRLLLSRASAVAPSLLPRQPAVARSLLPRADGSILQLWYRTGSTFVVDWARNGAEAGDKGLGARAPVVLSREDGSLVAWPRGGCFCKNIGS
jgi:hypothetical protein